MSLEELCTTKKPPILSKTSFNGNSPFNDLILELMRDRLIELQKFIHFDQASKQVAIDSTSAKENGYILTVS